MVIRELTRQASLAVLSRNHLGQLAYAKANQPFLVLMFFACHEDSLYCASTIGQKIEWMRDNPLVAVEVDEIENAQHWQSVVVLGRYEEIPQTPEMQAERQLAWSLLQGRELDLRTGERDRRRNQREAVDLCR